MPDHARSDDPEVQRQLDRFAQLSPGRDVLGLERITELLARLGDPHLRLPPVLHVAGTNGKGSTCAFLRAALEAAGLRVHVYTSPHLVRFNERIRLAGRLIDDATLAPLLAEVLDAAGEIGPSFFEATTAAAFLAFARTSADACVVEVGLGGRLDATNVVRPAVGGIAQIGLDHQAFLGETLAEMGAEKAGIAKRGVPLVCLEQPREAMTEIERIAGRAGAPLLIESHDWAIDDTLEPALSGAHQLRNASLAAAMLRRFGVEDRAIHAGIAAARWPARLQRLAPGPLTRERAVWIDGAHNPAAAAALAEAMPGKRVTLILGILANKDADGIINALAPQAANLIFVSVSDHDSHDPVTLAVRWNGRAASSLEDALAMSEGDALIAGSLYLAGEALRLNSEHID